MVTMEKLSKSKHVKCLINESEDIGFGLSAVIILHAIFKLFDQDQDFKVGILIIYEYKI
jgi:hypothetical protein